MILSFNGYNSINESVRSELFKSGMCVMYSEDGENTNYFYYLVLTEKKDIEKTINDLKWPTTFSESDAMDMLNDKYGVLITSRENGCRYVCIDDVLVNNILYIWDTDLKLDDCIKDKYIIDLSKKCNIDNLVYEKDVDYTTLVKTYPEPPYYNYGWNPDNWTDMAKGYSSWPVTRLSSNPGVFIQPVPFSI